LARLNCFPLEFQHNQHSFCEERVTAKGLRQSAFQDNWPGESVGRPLIRFDEVI